jgi:hypothetical protein
MVSFPEGSLLCVKIARRFVDFLAFQAYLFTGLLPLLVVESGGHAQAKGWARQNSPPVSDFRHPQSGG